MCIFTSNGIINLKIWVKLGLTLCAVARNACQKTRGRELSSRNPARTQKLRRSARRLSTKHHQPATALKQPASFGSAHAVYLVQAFRKFLPTRGNSKWNVSHTRAVLRVTCFDEAAESRDPNRVTPQDAKLLLAANLNPY